MNKQYKIPLLIFIMLIHSIGSIFSQTEQYKFRRLTTEDGLPTNRTHMVLKDSRGFIWISTRVGVCRYDGYTIKTYPYERMMDKDNNMVEDNDGNIWLCSYNGLSKIDIYTESYHRYVHDTVDRQSISSNYVYCIYKDKLGTFWIGTSRGLNRYYPETDNFRSFNTDTFISAYSNNIRVIYEDQAKKLWVGTADGLFLFNRETKKFTSVKLASSLQENIQNLSIRSITQDTDGTIIIGTKYGFLQYDKVKEALLPSYLGFDLEFTIGKIKLLVDPLHGDQIFWIIWNKLYKYDKSKDTVIEVTKHNPSNPSDIIGAYLESIYIDESGLKWLTSNWGVSISVPDVCQIEKTTGLVKEYDNATVFLRDSDKHFWIGLVASQLLHFDENMKLLKAYNWDDFPVIDGKKESPPSFHVIIEDRDKNIWLGDTKGGVYLLEHGKQEFVPWRIPGYQYKKPGFIYDIHEDSSGVIWIASNRGLFMHKKNTFPLTDFENVNSGSYVDYGLLMRVFEDHYGNLWVGSHLNGLFCLTPENRKSRKFVNYVHEAGNEQSITIGPVWSVHEDVNLNLWIGTETGLNRFIREDKTFEHFVSATDPAATFVMDMSSDNRGYLWLITQKGLIKFKPGNNLNGGARPYFIKQVLPFTEICPWNIDKTSDGKMYIGGIFGSGTTYHSFYPDSIKENQSIPPIFITDFLIRNEPVRLDTDVTMKKIITLNYNENFFSFKFTALDYTNPSENQYAYFLEGLDDDWTYSGNRRLANYTKVPPGEYVFRVRGSNNDGYWNEKGAFVRITILPPPWKTWWAYLIYGLVVIAILFYLIHYYRRRQSLSHKLAIEQLESEKLKELDSMKSRFFANISHEFRTPLTLIIGPIEKLKSIIKDNEARVDLNMMKRNARRLQNLINQLLNLSKIESGQMKLKTDEENIVMLINGYMQFFESLAKQKDTDLVFNSTESNIQVYVDKDKLEKILYNLLSNAFKNTPEGGRIEVEVSNRKLVVGTKTDNDKLITEWRLPTGDLPDSWVEIEISDTGRGIPASKLEHIFDRFYQADDSPSNDNEGSGIGLALTKELVEMHHGKIMVHSEEGIGTTFTVFLPMGKEHLKEEEIISGSPLEVDDKMMDFDDIGIEPEVNLQTNNADIKDASLPMLLVVEDNTDLRAYIRSYLDQHYSVIEAVNGSEGLAMAIEKIPDLVVSDVMMPEMDGIELCRQIKTNPISSHIPVILLTARASSEDKIEGLETGADDYISKPFDPKEMLVRIHNLIQQRQKLKEHFKNITKQSDFPQLVLLPESGLSTMDQKFIQRAIEVVEKNLADEKFNVEIFQQEVAMSRMQLHRKLKAITNLSASGFIRTVRLNHAADLIIQGSGNITEIAYEVGFSSLSYFTKSFKEQYGVLPSEYKR